MSKYSIPESNLESLETKLTRIRNKAIKYGCSFNYEKIGEHYRKITNTDGTSEIIRFIDVEVSGTAIINNWQFVASLEHTTTGNIISGISGIEVPTKYYDCAPYCEHCKTMRDRKNSYIVYNTISHEFKQVGKSCLKDFTNGLDSEIVAGFESMIKELEEAREINPHCYIPNYYNTQDVLTMAIEAIKIYGYVKSGTDCKSTASRVIDLYKVWDNRPLGVMRDVLKAQYEEAIAKGFNMDNPDSKTLAETIRKWIASSDDNSNYFHNLKVACADDYATGKTIGLLVSSIVAHDKNLEYQKQAQAENTSKYVGNVGDKLSFKIVDCKALTSWETVYGVTIIYKIVDADGNVYTWKTGNCLDNDCIGKTIKGTVKSHNEYRDIKQTELTRCRVY